MRNKHCTSLHIFSRCLIGGVLLGVCFSLVPCNVHAATYIENSQATSGSGSNTNNNWSFRSGLRYGCATKAVELSDGTVITTVLNSDLTAPGYSTPMACSWYLSSSHNLARYGSGLLSDSTIIKYAGGSYVSTNTTTPSGVQDYSSTDTFPALYSAVSGIAAFPGSSGDFTINPNSIENSRFIGHLSFNMPSYTDQTNWSYGFQPGFDNTSVRLKNIYDNTYLHNTNADRYSSYITDLTEHTYFTCGDYFDNDRWYGNIPADTFQSGNIVCSVFFSMPNVPNYAWEFTDGFSFNTGTGHIETLPGDSFVSANHLSYDDVAYMFINLTPYGRSNPTSRYSAFEFSNPIFQIQSCDDQAECDYFINLSNNYSDSRSASWVNPTANPSGNFWDSWFNVFDFSFLFPFRSIFGMFTDDSCVEIPVIAGMLNTGSTYCTWWSPSVRSILTPVFTTFSLMLITGFAFSWLTNGRSFTIDGSLARSTNKKAKGD